MSFPPWKERSRLGRVIPSWLERGVLIGLFAALNSFFSAGPVIGADATVAVRTADCAVLERLAGTWMGRGSMRRHAQSGAEPMRCRLDSDWDGGQREVESRLDCRGVDGELTFVATLTAVDGQERVTGTLEGSQGLDQGVLNGWCEADSVKLGLIGRSLTTGDQITAELVLSLSEDDRTLINAMEVQDPDSGESFSALDLRFER